MDDARCQVCTDAERIIVLNPEFPGRLRLLALVPGVTWLTTMPSLDGQAGLDAQLGHGSPGDAGSQHRMSR